VGDGFEAEKAVLNLRAELGVGGFVGAGRVQRDVGVEAGDGAGGIRVRSQSRRADEIRRDDVAAVEWKIAVAQRKEQIGFREGRAGHFARSRWLAAQSST